MLRTGKGLAFNADEEMVWTQLMFRSFTVTWEMLHMVYQLIIWNMVLVDS